MIDQIKIEGLTVAEWCDLWANGNDQYRQDKINVGDVRDELARIAAVVKTLMAMVDGVELPEFEHDAKFADVDGVNWFDKREEITGKAMR
jgi:hypothetical protein